MLLTGSGNNHLEGNQIRRTQNRCWLTEQVAIICLMLCDWWLSTKSYSIGYFNTVCCCWHGALVTLNSGTGHWLWDSQGECIPWCLKLIKSYLIVCSYPGILRSKYHPSYFQIMQWQSYTDRFWFSCLPWKCLSKLNPSCVGCALWTMYIKLVVCIVLEVMGNERLWNNCYPPPWFIHHMEKIQCKHKGGGSGGQIAQRAIRGKDIKQNVFTRADNDNNNRRIHKIHKNH